MLNCGVQLILNRKSIDFNAFSSRKPFFFLLFYNSGSWFNNRSWFLMVFSLNFRWFLFLFLQFIYVSIVQQVPALTARNIKVTRFVLYNLLASGRQHRHFWIFHISTNVIFSGWFAWICGLVSKCGGQVVFFKYDKKRRPYWQNVVKFIRENHRTIHWCFDNVVRKTCNVVNPRCLFLLNVPFVFTRDV